MHSSTLHAQFLSTAVMPASNLLDMFVPMYEHAPKKAISLLFAVRNPRGGLGRKHSYRSIIEWMLDTKKSEGFFSDNLSYLVQWGCWQDLKQFVDTDVWPDVLWYWCHELTRGNRLAAKWAPRRRRLARQFKDELQMTNKAYRQMLYDISNTVEQHMCARQWYKIYYPSVPAVAMKNYRKSFRRRDLENFTAYLKSDSGDTTIHNSFLSLIQVAYQGRLGDQNSMLEEIIAPYYKTLNFVRLLE